MELNTSNLIYSLTQDFDFIPFTRVQAENIYRLLLRLGATKDIKFNWDEESGQIYIMKRIYFGDTESDAEMPNAARQYSLDQYLNLLIRFDKSAHNRMRNVEKKIQKMMSVPEGLKAQLRN